MRLRLMEGVKLVSRREMIDCGLQEALLKARLNGAPPAEFDVTAAVNALAKGRQRLTLFTNEIYSLAVVILTSLSVQHARWSC